MSFLTHGELLDTLAETTFERPPALVANAHITGLGVARALAAHGVPVVAVDRTGDGVAPPSKAVRIAGEVTYPLTDRDGFRADIEALADAAGTEFVAFGCMDEWVRGFAETDPEGVRLPFAPDAAAHLLNKSRLYRTAERLGIPYPETVWLDEAGVEDALAHLGLPLIVKPARKRAFEELVGTNVIEVETETEFRDIVSRARDAGIELLAQEVVVSPPGTDHSLASYVGSEETHSLVGNARLRNPPAFGTSCLVERTEKPVIEERALAVIDDAGYTGISESEFVYHPDREEFLLLDINTRPWKWIGLPVTAGLNLPMAAYAAATDATYSDDGPRDGRWLSLADYVEVLAGGEPDVLEPADWHDLVSGAFEQRPDLTTAVYRQRDPEPTYQLLRTKLGTHQYYCSC